MIDNRKKRAYPFVVYYLRRYVSPGDRLLDIGCGTAQYRTSTPGIYVGLDCTNDPMPDGYLRDVDIVASATDIPQPDRTYDLIFSVGAFYQISDTGRALSEFHRLLKPGGRIMLFDYNRRTQRRLSCGEAAERPCWTQWQLRRVLKGAGFRECTLLVPRVEREVGKLEAGVRLLAEELVGIWAVVTGVK